MVVKNLCLLLFVRYDYTYAVLIVLIVLIKQNNFLKSKDKKIGVLLFH